MNDTWEIYESSNGEWRWRRTASNGEIVGASTEGFSSQESAERNAELVGYNDQYGDYDDDNWEFYEDDSGEHRWRLTASNGQNVCSASEGYSSKDACVSNAERHGYNA